MHCGHLSAIALFDSSVEQDLIKWWAIYFAFWLPPKSLIQHILGAIVSQFSGQTFFFPFLWQQISWSFLNSTYPSHAYTKSHNYHLLNILYHDFLHCLHFIYPLHHLIPSRDPVKIFHHFPRTMFLKLIFWWTHPVPCTCSIRLFPPCQLVQIRHTLMHPWLPCHIYLIAFDKVWLGCFNFGHEYGGIRLELVQFRSKTSCTTLSTYSQSQKFPYVECQC